jgi:peptidyl-prolyl cis-trans isomerase NIMA-interacting 1
MRLAPVFVLALFGCGGGQSEAKAPKTEQLTPGEKCIEDANVKQVPPVDAPQRIDVAHILIKHDQVKGAIKEGVTRTREAACLRANEARKFVLSSNDWDAAYEKYADGGGATKGELSDIAQGDAEKKFSDAAFSLGAGEVSHVVESPRGFHVIVRKQ